MNLRSSFVVPDTSYRIVCLYLQRIKQTKYHTVNKNSITTSLFKIIHNILLHDRPSVLNAVSITTMSNSALVFSTVVLRSKIIVEFIHNTKETA